MDMSTLDNGHTQDSKAEAASVLGLVAVALGAIASLLWVAFLGWGLGWVVAQLIHLVW